MTEEETDKKFEALQQMLKVNFNFFFNFEVED